MQDKTQALAHVMDHIVRRVVFRIGPVEITSTVVNTWIVMAVLFAAVFVLTRRLEEKPRGVQALLEIIIEFFYSMIDGVMGREGRKHLPIVGSLFIFILTLNFGWVIPGLMPPTTDLMTTAALGVTAVVLVQVTLLRAKGAKGYLRHMAQPTVVMIPMNIIEELVKPFSLAVRLFGNMFGEEMVVTILFLLVPVLAPTPVMALGLLMGTIQAYIFSLLIVTYLAAGDE
ncbi:MAG: F0F1 ATP synthase subunit A [Limnochordia bacterium]